MSESLPYKTIGNTLAGTLILIVTSMPAFGVVLPNLQLDVADTGRGVLICADGADIVIEHTTFRDGGDPGFPRAIPGDSSFTPLVITYNRDIGGDQASFHNGMLNWTLEVVQGELDFRRDARLLTRNAQGDIVESTLFRGMFPIEFNAATPDYSIGNQRIYEMSFAFDDMSIEILNPEPASVTLLAVGGLTLLLPRRGARGR